MSSRQQQRSLERALVKRGQSVLSAGLPVKPDKADVVAIAFLLARTLTDKTEPCRAVAAARQLHQLTEASVKRTPGTAKLACAKGCSYCCHAWASATAPEILLLAHAIREDASRRPGLESEIAARARPNVGLTPLQRYGAKRACPLLVDQACIRYRERPTVCRQATSLDLSGCIEEFEGRGFESDIKVSAVFLAHARNSRVPLLAALRLAGLPPHSYELSAGLSRALEYGNGEAAWLGGIDVFAGIARAPAEPPAIEQAIGAITTELASLFSRPG